jgi:pentapeptide MXKDX repeat protein
MSRLIRSFVGIAAVVALSFAVVGCNSSSPAMGDKMSGGKMEADKMGGGKREVDKMGGGKMAGEKMNEKPGS